ncbi:hypothetical protein [Acetobacterium wieringae]|uniref:hypothetical protein n=1 Tax=Acetobacterium wieringae TaxID=52694 RepID=UPI0026EADF38|nr:hypothetical protein [Acetobacterium wieringae]
MKIQDSKILINDILISSNEYIQNAKKALKHLSEEFYQAPESKSWTDLADFFEGIQWILETISRIDQISNLETIISNYKIWNEYVQNIKGLNEIVRELDDAMKNNDHVLIGDLLQYEVLPIFEGAEHKLGLLMVLGGHQHVS